MRLYHRPVGHPLSLPVSEILFKDLFFPVNQEDVQGKRIYASPGDPSEQNGCLNSFFKQKLSKLFSVKIVTKCLLILPSVFDKCCDPV